MAIIWEPPNETPRGTLHRQPWPIWLELAVGVPLLLVWLWGIYLIAGVL